MEASRCRLALLTGPADVHRVLEHIRRFASGCTMLNIGLVFSQELLEIPSHQRPAQAPRILADLLAGEEPVMLYDIELLFDPSLQLQPLRALKAASRLRDVLALWPGRELENRLIHAEPGHPEYKQYDSAELADVFVVRAADLVEET